NGFLNFIPMEPPKEEMLAVMGGLFGIKYMLPLVKGIEVVVGAALLTNKFVPLALTVISPIIVNIFLIHAIYAPEGLPMAIFVVVANIFLAYSHKDAFKGVLKA
ncbi:MAG: acyltransferase, partial [Bdellovibrionales bacterium]|nr:acyltransferase [Bdellovibrionales bacterium]